jgi:hypothetical protein
MLRRFCLYGFVKNQKYFEPFLYLALLEKLSFAGVGMPLGFRRCRFTCSPDPLLSCSMKKAAL